MTGPSRRLVSRNLFSLNRFANPIRSFARTGEDEQGAITNQWWRVPFLAPRRASPAGVTVVCAAALLPSPVASAPETGRLTGHVVVTAAVSSPLRSAAYATRRVERVAPISGSELANVVVFVQDAPRVSARCRRPDRASRSREKASRRGSSPSHVDRRSTFPTATRSSTTCSRCPARPRSISGATRGDRADPRHFRVPGW